MARATAPVTPVSSPRPAGGRGEVNHLIVPLTLVLALLYLLAAWTLDAVSRLPPMVRVERAAVTFRDGTGYGTALKDVTNLGLRQFNPCVEAAIALGDIDWSKTDEFGDQEASFSQTFLLIIAATVISPEDWVMRLSALPDVGKVDTQVTASCPKLTYETVLSRLLTAPPAPRPAVLQFGLSVAYHDALRVAADRGLRLADPCYEAAVAQGKHPAWHSESQQRAFARTATLVVAPTILTPNDWLLRLPSDVTPGPVIATCA